MAQLMMMQPNSVSLREQLYPHCSLGNYLWSLLTLELCLGVCEDTSWCGSKLCYGAC